MDSGKEDQIIGNLYRIKELYRVQGENVCDAAAVLVRRLRESNVPQVKEVTESMNAVMEAIAIFESEERKVRN